MCAPSLQSFLTFPPLFTSRLARRGNLEWISKDVQKSKSEEAGGGKKQNNPIRLELPFGDSHLETSVQEEGKTASKQGQRE